MVYITVRQSPIYHQMTLEEYLFQNYQTPPVVNANIANTRTYEVENVSEHFSSKIGVEALIGKLVRFNNDPHQSFSMVSDSYDYWNLVEKVLPQLKDDILNHDGFISIRGDSGDPVSVITETVYRLWDIFGGTVNSKGYKVLNPHVKAIYGDSITPQRCEQIYSLLEKNGFAINNVSLGVGSFSMECLETIESDGSKQYNPYTRDTFGIAVKATYAEDADGKPIMIFKNPKTDTGHFKKSQRGCCRVVKTNDGYDYVDGLTWAEAQDSNELRTVFRDGKFEKQFTLDEVRKNLHGGTF